MIKKSTLTEQSAYSEYLNSFSKSGVIKEFPDVNKYLKERGMLKKIMDVMPCGIAVLDYQTQRYIYASESVKMITGWSSDEIKGKGPGFWSERIHPDDFAQFATNSFPKLLNALHSFEEEEIRQCKFSVNYRFKRKDNTWVMLLQNTVILEMDENRNPLLLLNVATDITNYKTDNSMIFSVTHCDKDNNIKSISSTRLISENDTSVHENDIIKLILSSYSSNQIATKLFISFYTVRAHRRNILEKTHCKNSSDLTRYAIANGIV